MKVLRTCTLPAVLLSLAVLERATTFSALAKPHSISAVDTPQGKNLHRRNIDDPNPESGTRVFNFPAHDGAARKIRDQFDVTLAKRTFEDAPRLERREPYKKKHKKKRKKKKGYGC
ncbi:hypothetical protein M8J76_007036 [Diaphorina citri]|nr:hypothetical protein M8J75_010937 [Diaphorina citri]KAI5722345.1 hypothetical protein M8J76_007036 [Diaphorina citri]